MAISRNTRIEDIEFEPTLSGGGRRFHRILASYETYGGLLDAIEEAGGIEHLPDMGEKRAVKLQNFIEKNPPIESQGYPASQFVSSINSFSIMTPNMPLEEKLRAATAGIDAPLVEVAVAQFKKGAVVIEP